MKKNKNRGITLASLVITIIVLLIIAGISVYSGTDIIKRAKLEELKTNMLLIETKAKECVENANFKLGKTDNLGDTEKTTRINEAKKELKGIEITEADNINIELNDYNYYYKLTEDNLKDMGLSNIKLSDTDELYIVKYDIQNAKVEVYNTKGYEGKYSLTDIEQIEK